MTSLFDIVPNIRKLKTSVGEIEVPGMGIDGIVSMLKSNPELIEMFQNGEGEFNFQTVLDMGLDVSAQFLAAGLGRPGDEAAIDRCKKLKPEDAYDIGTAIIEETFPSGAKSFFDKVQQALAKLKITASQLNNKSSTALQKPVKD